MKLKPISVRPHRSGKAEFLEVFQNTLQETIQISRQDPERLYHLRCSQIPYCANSVISNYGTRGMYFAMDLRMAYYVSVGHAVHAVMQSYLAESKRFIADYECLECNTKYPLSRVSECCGFPTKYEEVSINYKGIQGHIDGIFVDSQDRIWIVDYKTSSLLGAPLKVKNPPLNYRRQVRAYAYLLWKQHKIKVFGCMLVFLPRDKPWSPEVWEHRMGDQEYEDAKLELRKDRDLHRKTMKASTLEEMMALSKTKCMSEYCPACKRSNSENKKLFTRLLKNPKLYPIKK